MAGQIMIKGKGLVSRHIRSLARPAAEGMRDGSVCMNTVLMLAIGQCAQDELTLLYNLPEFKGKYHAEKVWIKSAFNQQRKGLRRHVSGAEFARFEEIVCGLTDECWRRTEWLNAIIKGELAQKVPYGKVEVGALLGISHGLVYACDRIHRIMTGKGSSVYGRIMEELERMDGKVGFELLNGDGPDGDVCAEAIVKLIFEMQDAVVRRFTGKGESA